MFKNYLKLAWRSLIKEKVYSVVNIIGLAGGIASSLIILLYISKELSFDTFHEKADRIYRISLSFRNGNESSFVAWAPGPVAGSIKDVIPEIDNVAQVFSKETDAIVERGEVRIYEPRFVYANPAFFELFDFPLVSGDALKALAQPYSVLISESMAAKYFLGEDPLGNILEIDNKRPYKVVGVFENIPDNSHIRFDFVASLESLYASGMKRDNWFAGGMHTYALLGKQVSGHTFQEKLDKFRDMKMSGPFNFKAGQPPPVALVATPLTDIHLHTGFAYEMIPQGDIVYVYIFSAIELLILLIACINYTNLATALAVKRAREVGIRKVHGARRPELIRQYLSESFLFVGIALVLSFVLTELCLPSINDILNRTLDIRWTDPKVFLIFGGLWLLVGLGAGLYPALYLSGFNAGRILKSQEQVQSKNVIRKTLITFQLTVSIALIASVLVIRSQMALVQLSRPGLDQEQVIMIPTRSEFADTYAVLRDRLGRQSNVSSITTSSFQPGQAGSISFYSAKDIEGLSGEDAIVVDAMNVGYDFEKTFKLNIVKGRSFSEEFKTDLEEAIIVNESAVRKFGWTDPIGKTISPSGEVAKRVVGVIEDFHYKSLRDEIVPLILTLTPQASQFIAVRLNKGAISSGIGQVESAWHEIVPQLPFTYSFLDQSFDALYRTESRLNTLVGVFSLLAVVIAVLGLLGLSAFTAEQRTKEIGIRKTLGASIGSIVTLLMGDFIKWVGLALVIAVPCTHYAMTRWLQTFQYKIQIQPWYYLGAGMIILIMVLLTTGWRSIHAALKNPVDVLNNE